MYTYIYIYIIHICVCVYIYIYYILQIRIYIYIERERYRKREIYARPEPHRPAAGARHQGDREGLSGYFGPNGPADRMPQVKSSHTAPTRYCASSQNQAWSRNQFGFQQVTWEIGCSCCMAPAWPNMPSCNVTP